MNPKKITTTIKTFLHDYWALVTSGILLLILINFVILPIYQKINDLQYRIMVEKNELETKYIRRQTIRRTLLSLQHTKDEWPKLYNSFYPESGQELNFINTVEHVADANKLNQNLRLEPALASNLASNIQVIPMEVTLIGDFPNLLSYLHTIENQSYIIQLQTLKISRVKTDGTVQADIRFNTYWQQK